MCARSPLMSPHAAALPVGLSLRRGGNLVNREIGAVEFVFGIHADTDHELESAVHNQAAAERDHDTEHSSTQLRHQAHTPETAEPLRAEDARCNAAPCATQSMQRPHTEHVVDLPAVL